ncbi:pilus assembly PilX N-terminal domain-containing protein [Candidatus Riflebacteria bacterium]
MIKQIKYRKRGSALITVVIFVCVLTSIGLALYKASKKNRKVADWEILKRQAEFIARAGIEHAFLKFRLYPSELYDSAALASGKNPFFSFRRLADTCTHGKKKNLYECVTGKKNKTEGPPIIVKIDKNRCETSSTGRCTIPGGSKYKTIPLRILPSNRRFVSKKVMTAAALNAKPALKKVNLNVKTGVSVGPAEFKKAFKGRTNLILDEPADLAKLKKDELYLWKYRRDISSHPDIQPALSFPNGKPGWKVEMGEKKGGPYDALYYVRSMKIRALPGERIYDKEAIELVVVGYVYNPKFKKGFAATITETKYVERKE